MAQHALFHQSMFKLKNIQRMLDCAREVSEHRNLKPRRTDEQTVLYVFFARAQ